MRWRGWELKEEELKVEAKKSMVEREGIKGGGIEGGGEKERGVRWIGCGIPMSGVGSGGATEGRGAAALRDQTINPPVSRISGKHTSTHSELHHSRLVAGL